MFSVSRACWSGGSSWQEAFAEAVHGGAEVVANRAPCVAAWAAHICPFNLHFRFPISFSFLRLYLVSLDEDMVASVSHIFFLFQPLLVFTGLLGENKDCFIQTHTATKLLLRSCCCRGVTEHGSFWLPAEKNKWAGHTGKELTNELG